MANWRDFLFLDEDELRKQCEEEIFRASGPGGQHRNKVSSAVRLKHKSSGQMVTASERRSQHENRHIAIKRMRMAIALNCRVPGKAEEIALPSWFNDCLSPVKNAPTNAAPYRLSVSAKNPKFWPIAALLLDLLAGEDAKLGPLASKLGVSTSNLTRLFKTERHLYGAVQSLRKSHGQKPLT